MYQCDFDNPYDFARLCHTEPVVQELVRVLMRFNHELDKRDIRKLNIRIAGFDIIREV